MTDSINRLYQAYFQRNPDEVGFDHWVRSYAGGERSLVQIASAFEQTPEFEARYGAVADDAFVSLVYRNVLARTSDPGGRAYWRGRLETGMSRGQLMVAFSESREFVERTGTMAPLAGFLRTYPTGTVWACGSGSQQLLMARSETSRFVDVLAVNADVSAPQSVMVQTLGGATDLLTEMVLDPAQYSLTWNHRTHESAAQMVILDVQASPFLSWTVVFYPSTMAADRPGWDAGEPHHFR